MIPKISLVICSHNRASHLATSLHSVRPQTLGKSDFEVIVVDNASTDNTSVLVSKFILANPLINVKYCFEKNKGLGFARNRGLTEASAPIVTFVDDDTMLPPAYLEQLVLFFRFHPESLGVGGKVIPLYVECKEPVWMSKYLNGFVGKVDHGPETMLYDKEMKYPAGCNMTYTKAILFRVGGFNNSLKWRSDDKDIFNKIRQLTDKIYYVPAAWLFHRIDKERLSFKNFKRLFLRTGNAEKNRTHQLAKKFIEYVVKFAASLALFVVFLFKGQFLKGKYVVLSQAYTLMGFLRK